MTNEFSEDILRRVSALLAMAEASPSWDALSPEQNRMVTVLTLLFGDVPGEDAAWLRAGVLAAADAEPEITDADAARTCERLGIDVTAWAAEIRAKVAARRASVDDLLDPSKTTEADVDRELTALGIDPAALAARDQETGL